MSRRQELFDAVKVELEKIVGSTVKPFPVSIEDARDRYALPFLGMVYAAERKETAATASTSNKQSELDILVDVYVRHDTDPLTALNTQIESIETQIEDEVKLGKVYPVFARVVEIEMAALSEETQESGGSRYGVGTVLIRITYRHDRAIP
jgi:transcription antitermination factor NusG